MRCNSVALVGGKAASLARLTQAGCNVPVGFAITTAAFAEYIKQNSLMPLIVKILAENSLENASKKIRQLFTMPLHKTLAKDILNACAAHNLSSFAVRSSAAAEDSATASFAGELETYLNCTTKDILENIARCWSSLFTPRAIVYMQEKSLNIVKNTVGVVIQQMLDPDVSGVAFTAHPVTADRNLIYIEAVYGLGEQLVSGTITPDSYQLKKNDGTLLHRTVTKQMKQVVRAKNGTKVISVPAAQQNHQKLSSQNLVTLHSACKKIEKMYAVPMDIEWAFVKNKLSILQARPITTL